MAELEKLRRRKICAKGWLTKSVQKLEQSLTSKGVKLIDLESLMRDFDKRLSDFDVADELYEQELPEGDIFEAIEVAGVINVINTDHAVDVRNKAPKIFNELKAKDSAGDDARSWAVSSQQGSADPSVRLPKLQLPKFSGNACARVAPVLGCFFNYNGCQ